MLTDIKTYTPSVTAFEVGARGFLTTDNIKRLKTIHSFCKKSIKQKTFLQNISAIANNSSYYLFNSRKEPTWSNVGYFNPPF